MKVDMKMAGRFIGLLTILLPLLALLLLGQMISQVKIGIGQK